MLLQARFTHLNSWRPQACFSRVPSPCSECFAHPPLLLTRHVLPGATHAYTCSIMLVGPAPTLHAPRSGFNVAHVTRSTCTIVPCAPFAGQSTSAVKVSTEWLRGETLCTVSGKYHLAWIVPMSDVSYYTPSAAIHSFLMFAPFFVLRSNMIIQGVVLWATGPALAAYITPNLMEQASIWCFFSIAQIGVMLFLIRNVLVTQWGKSGVSTSEKTTASDPHMTFSLGWPMDVKVDTASKGK